MKLRRGAAEAEKARRADGTAQVAKERSIIILYKKESEREKEKREKKGDELTTKIRTCTRTLFTRGVLKDSKSHKQQSKGKKGADHQQHTKQIRHLAHSFDSIPLSLCWHSLSLSSQREHESLRE
jgi:hypothetical protein